MKLLIKVIVFAAIGFVALTWWALESSGVGEIETQTAEGSTRWTHVWYIESADHIWIEAGTPENDWYVDILADPIVSFSSDDHNGAYKATPIPGRAAHDRIRAQLRKKYGFRDWWVDLLFDTSRSIAVRLAAPPAIR